MKVGDKFKWEDLDWLVVSVYPDGGYIAAIEMNKLGNAYIDGKNIVAKFFDKKEQESITQAS